ncbi:MAG: hypothetical protein B6245_04980 [Desulfobacteraceae bacterium 4572_88]|nr:MAG: hypothetical protein B6245_04980 [Desulfobacteraceae bacterium 4572_88]
MPCRTGFAAPSAMFSESARVNVPHWLTKPVWQMLLRIYKQQGAEAFLTSISERILERVRYFSMSDTHLLPGQHTYRIRGKGNGDGNILS